MTTEECREPLDLIRLSIGASPARPRRVEGLARPSPPRALADERIYVKCRGDRELRGKLHVRRPASPLDAAARARARTRSLATTARRRRRTTNI